MKEFSLIKKEEEEKIEEIEISENGELQGWCTTLKKLGLFNCDKDCSSCYCG